MLLDHWDSIDELFHILQQGANNQVIGKKAAYVGYIVKWFPNNTVIVSNPLGGTIPPPIDPLDVSPGVNNTGIPVLSNPMPLSTAFCGTPGINPINPGIKAGIVLAPLGGALPSSKDQALGEQVLVILVNNKQGYQATAFMMFDNVATPPSLSIPVTSQQLKPGEWLYVNPSGTHSHWRNDGSLLTYAMNPKDDADGGNLYLYAGAKNDAFGGSICLQTGLVNSQPSPPELAGDIQIVARNNIEMAALDVGLETTYSIIMAAGTHLQLGAALDAVIQSIDVGVLADNNFVATATKNILLNANEGDVTINAFADTSNVIVNATHSIALNAYGGNWDGYCAFGNMTLLATVGSITIAGDGGVDISSNNGNVNITTQGNQLLLSAPGGLVHVTGREVNIETVSSLFPLAITAAGILNMTSDDDMTITATNGNLDLNAFNGKLELYGSNAINLNSPSTIDIVASGTVSLYSSAGGDVDIGSVTKSTVTSNISLTAYNNITVSSVSGSMVFQTQGGAGNMTLQTDKAAHFTINTGTASITGQVDIGIATITGSVTINAKTDAIVQGGNNVILRDGSGNTPKLVMLEDLITEFNNHTHGGVTTGGGSTATPDSPLSPGYPLTSDATHAN